MSEIDTLTLNIEVKSEAAEQSLASIESSIRSIIKTTSAFDDASKELGQSLSRIGYYMQAIPKGNMLGSAARQFQEFSDVIGSVNTGAIQNNVTVLKSAIDMLSTAGADGNLAGIGKFISLVTRFSATLSTLDTSTFNTNLQTITAGFGHLTNALSTFIAKISGAKEELIALSNILDRLNIRLKATDGEVARAESIGGGSFGLYRTITRAYFLYRIIYRISKVLTDIVEKGINFNETLNLWQVAMRGNVEQASAFVDEMSKAYGFATTTLMQYQATFRNMVSALGGISAEASYTLSEALVAFGTDFASLYNTTLETAMEKLQAVLAGQIRPIRAISGYDVSKNTIYELYQQIGGKKTQGEITETEKRLLRVYAVMVQMKNAGALGDMEKTLNNSANQLRMMKELAKEFFTWIGNGVQALFESSGIFQKINTYLFAGIELAKSFATNLGYVQKDFGLDTQFEDVNDEIDEAQGKLASFDKFNVLGDTGKGADNVSDNIISAITGELGDWKKRMRESETYMSLQQKAEGILEKLGLKQKEITDETGKEVGYVWELQKGTGSLLSVLKLVSSAIGGIGAVIASVAVVQKISSVVQALSKAGKLAKLLEAAFSPVGITIMAVAAALAYMYKTNKEFRESVNALVKAIVGLVKSALAPFLSIAKDILGVITIVLDSAVAPILTALIKAVTWVLEGVSAILNLKETLISLKAVIYGIVAVIALVKLPALIFQIGHTIGSISTLIASLKAGVQAFFALYGAEMVAVGGLVLLAVGIAAMGKAWDKIGNWQKIITIFTALAAAVTTAAVAIAVFHASWTMGIGAAAIVAGIALIIGAFASVKAAEKGKKFAAGGTAEKGSLFLAGEAGPELVTQTSGGSSTIMNMQQLEDAVARGFMRAMVATDGGEQDVNVTINLGGKTIATVYDLLKSESKRRGDTWR